MTELIKKYDVPVPRYTSYPTVPYWDNTEFSGKVWMDSVRKSFLESNEREGISLYIHLPFCESLCTFCACHKYITKNHHYEAEYIDALLKEWQMYLVLFDEKPRIRELHLGGGTPSFFSAANLGRLVGSMLESSEIFPSHSFSFEGHPNNTGKEHLETLYELGFRRVSFGVQDYSPDVQRAINRIQPFEQVRAVTDLARKTGYTSISHDLIYGLPFQTLEDIYRTIANTSQLRPDRLAFYSYAHVPWLKGNGQRGFRDSDVPHGDSKRQLYEGGKSLLENEAYKEIGMDHFALESDSLYQSMQNGDLHRNFMGYTDQHTTLLLGLGVSSIGDSWNAFGQNEKNLKDYYGRLSNNELPVVKGHLLSQEDLGIRRHILNIMCHLETKWTKEDQMQPWYREVQDRLEAFIEDGLVVLQSDGSMSVTEDGRTFLRNICSALDLRLHANKMDKPIFSKAV